MVNACTIIARNYLVHARVLARSFFAHHPDGRFTVLLIDDERKEFDGSREPFQCCRLSDIGLDGAEIGRLAAIYDVTELATAVKPPFLRHLLSAGASEVVYLDPDIKLYSSIEDVSDLARRHGIVLTPHMTSAMPEDGRRVDEFHILAAGVYNLGFLAVSAGANGLIDWWWQKTRRQARIDPARMMFTDQRWMDFAPSFFDHFILKDPTYNVAYWNLHERELTWTGDGYLVNGKPLTFFHFSGFDGKKPYLLSKHQGDRPRILLSERPAVAKICHEYLSSLEECGLSQGADVPYGWHALPSGLPFDGHMRRLYREGLDVWEGGEGPEPPNPFDADAEDRFMDWLNEPVGGGLQPTISRYLLSIYDARADLQSAFPDLAGPQGRAYLAWVLGYGVDEHNIPASLLPPRSGVSDDSDLTAAPTSGLTHGVNIAGYFRAEVGVGEAVRLLTSAVEAAGIPHSTVAYDATPSRKAHPFLERGDRSAPHDINILCVNADQTATFAKDAGPRFFDGRHTVGYWFWELDRFPTTMHQAFDYVDEVWTATRFVASGIRAIGRRPVYTIPLPVLIPRCSPAVTRSSLRLPSRFLFLFVFDFFSILERKNPVGLIQAFNRAFRPCEGPVLMIKTINGDRKLADLEKVRAACAGREDILIVDEYYSADEKNSLISLCDCYVSLHRSEGLGLTMAEAMGLEKPVIATAYSGNLDFMTPENSYLVDYAPGVVPAGCDPYPESSPWADPDLDQAAELMRRVVEAPAEAGRKAAQARRDIFTKHNVNITGVALRRRLNEIRYSRARVSVPTRSPSNRIANVDSATTPVRSDSSLAASLDHAASLLTPTPSVAPGRVFAGPLLFLQRLLFRIIRPYWWQQRHAQGLLVGGLRELAQKVAEHEERLRWMPEVSSSLDQHLSLLDAAQQDDDERLRRADERAVAVELRTRALEQHLTSIATFQESAAKHLKALTDQLASTTAHTTELSQRLHASPYMHEKERFRYSDEGGAYVLGFRTRRSADSGLYLGFEDIFRGSESFIRDRLRVYVPLLKDCERVIEIGCGRGELLDLLREAGVSASGVDIDEAMVQRCRAKGHTVEQGDAIGYLQAQADSSLPAIFAAQFVEHLPYEALISFLQLSLTKLKPGGTLIFETVNPHSLEAFKTFWTDLTHQRPIFPEVALVWCWLVGFERAYVMFPNGTGDLKSDAATRGEYAVIAAKAS
jgi:glycosyltransferase involved in cell wall biosynthesis/2-polyprenyl-3-methyl-5-hydroxy-6-metoxy-1,4-benzoquinol methylase